MIIIKRFFKQEKTWLASIFCFYVFLQSVNEVK
uniref:Uncharacterized protein n=1 Tax=Anguilla anguilla TaxID=7936 RepID=A0A0E9QN57_ANGAN